MTDHQYPEDWAEPVVVPDVVTDFRTILVPFDGSHSAEQALGYAVVLANGRDAEIVVVVAYNPPVTIRRRGSLVVPDARAEMLAEAEALASEAAGLLGSKGCRARAIVIEGDPVDGVLQAAADENADIILMGRRGLSSELRTIQKLVSGLSGGVHGSVAEKVARHATVPVLLVG